MSTFMDPKIKLLALCCSVMWVSLLIKILFIGHFEHTRAVLLIVGPMSENCGFVSPTTPAITSPEWIPILTVSFFAFLRVYVCT